MKLNWKTVGKHIASAGASLLGAGIAGPKGAEIGARLASALGVGQTPNEVLKALENKPEAMLAIKQLESDERRYLETLAVEAQQHAISADTDRLDIINQTMRAELQAKDRYRAGWRPAFGYVMAANLAVLSIAFLACSIAMFCMPESIANIANGFATMVGAMLPIFSIGLSVLGVAVHQRSKDKRLAAGVEEPSMLQKLASTAKAFKQ